MDQNKQNELIIHLLISIQSQFHAFRDSVSSYIVKDLGLDQVGKEKWVKKIKDSTKEAEKATKAQVALYYEGKFGNIDDLLDSINN